MKREFDCPECGKSIAIRFLKEGELAKCPACGRQTPVPADASGDWRSPRGSAPAAPPLAGRGTAAEAAGNAVRVIRKWKPAGGLNYVSAQVERCNRNLLKVNVATSAACLLTAPLAVVLNMRQPSTIGIMSGLVALFVLPVSLRNWYVWLRRSKAQPGHPVFRELARYGEPGKLSEDIDAELRTETCLALGPRTLTRSWLLDEDLFGFHAVPLSQIVWVFEKVTKHYRNFIPTGQTYELILRTLAGRERKLSFNNDETGTQEMARLIVAQNRRVIVGYDKELDRCWRSDPAGTGRMLAEGRTPHQAGDSEP